MKPVHHAWFHFHVGPIEFDLEAWVIPVVTLIFFFVAAFLITNPEWGVAGLEFSNINMAP